MPAKYLENTFFGSHGFAFVGRLLLCRETPRAGSFDHGIDHPRADLTRVGRAVRFQGLKASPLLNSFASSEANGCAGMSATERGRASLIPNML
jgi:hypothetical protein